MENQQVRGVFVIFAIGAALILFARRFAYWTEWEPRTFRVIGIVVLVLAVASVGDLFGLAAALKALLATALATAAYLWSDIAAERAELERLAREAEAAAEGDADVDGE